MEVVEKLTWMIADEFVESLEILWSAMVAEGDTEERMRSMAKTA